MVIIKKYNTSLTDLQKRKIIALRAEGMTRKAIGKKYNISEQTVTNICNRDTEFLAQCCEVKKKNSTTVAEHMAKQAPLVQSILDKALNKAVVDIEDAGIRELMGAIKILSEAYSDKTSKVELSGGVNIQFVDDLDKQS